MKGLQHGRHERYKKEAAPGVDAVGEARAQRGGLLAQQALAAHEGDLGGGAALAHLVGHDADGRAPSLHHRHLDVLAPQVHRHQRRRMRALHAPS